MALVFNKYDTPENSPPRGGRKTFLKIDPSLTRLVFLARHQNNSKLLKNGRMDNVKDAAMSAKQPLLTLCM